MIKGNKKPIDNSITLHVLVNFYNRYKDELIQIKKECNNGELNLGIYEMEKESIKNILSCFINDIKKNITSFNVF